MNFVFVLIANPAQPILDAALVQTVREQLEAAGAAVGPVDWLAPGIACDLPFEPVEGTTPTVSVPGIDAVALPLQLDIDRVRVSTEIVCCLKQRDARVRAQAPGRRQAGDA